MTWSVKRTAVGGIMRRDVPSREKTMMSEILGATSIHPYLVGFDDNYDSVNTPGLVKAIIDEDTMLAVSFMLEAWKLKNDRY
jgi:hypothetical protein